MTATAFASYQDAVKDAPLLGYVTWFTVANAAVEPAVLESTFNTLGIDKAFLPKPINAADSFRTATNPKTVSVTYDIDDDRSVTLLVRPVAGKDAIYRHVVREVQHRGKKMLEYDQGNVVAKLTYVHPATKGKVGATKLILQPPIERPAELMTDESTLWQAFVDDIRSEYESLRKAYRSQALRAVVRALLDDMGALRLKPGVYFVAPERQPELSQLRGLVASFSAASSVHLLPVPDVPEQRQELAARFEEAATERTDALITAVQEARREAAKGDLSDRKLAKLGQQYNDTKKWVESYETAIQMTRDSVTGALDVVGLTLMQLSK